MEWLDSIPATAVTAVTLIVLLYVGQLRGWIYVGRHVREMRADYERRISEVRADRDARLEEKNQELADWRQAYMNSEARADVAQAQVHRLLDGVDTTVQVVQSIPAGKEPTHG